MYGTGSIITNAVGSGVIVNDIVNKNDRGMVAVIRRVGDGIEHIRMDGSRFIVRDNNGNITITYPNNLTEDEVNKLIKMYDK